MQTIRSELYGYLRVHIIAEYTKEQLVEKFAPERATGLISEREAEIFMQQAEAL